MKKLIRMISMMLVVIMLCSVVGCQQRTVTKEEWVEVEGEEVAQGDETGDESENPEGEQADNTDSEDDKDENKNEQGNSTDDKNNSTGNNSSDKNSSTKPNGSSQNTSKKEKKLTGKLELQVFSNTADGNKAFEKILENFENENPDLDVTLRTGVNVHTQMLSRWMNDTPPDFVMLSGAGFPENTLQAAGKFYDFSSWFKTAKIWGTDTLIKDSIQDGMLIYNGKKLDRMPLSWGAYGLWYDSAYFKSNKLTMPKNYEGLVAFVDKAESLGKSAIVYPGVYSGYLVWGLVMPAIAAYGDEAYFNKVTGATDPSAFTDKRMKAVLTRLYDLAGDDKAFMKGTVQLNHIESQMEWLNHKSLIIPNGLWLEDEMADDTPSGFKMQFSPTSLATKDQDNYVIPYIGKFTVAKHGKNVENALAFVRYLYRPENIKALCEDGGTIPVTKQDYSKWKYSSTARASIDVIAGKSVKRMYLKNSWGTVDAEFNNVVNALVLHEITPDQACQRLKKACETYIRESK